VTLASEVWRGGVGTCVAQAPGQTRFGDSGCRQLFLGLVGTSCLTKMEGRNLSVR
jgi:hypothetical protein